jgi:hypothetical protein
MGLHGNARLGLGGRRLLVVEVAAAYSCREAARRRVAHRPHEKLGTRSAFLDW